MRMTAATCQVLSEMAAKMATWSYGSELSEATGVGTGSIYPILHRLERDGLLERQLEIGDPTALGRPLRVQYRITGAGSRVLAQERQKRPSWWFVTTVAT